MSSEQSNNGIDHFIVETDDRCLRIMVSSTTIDLQGHRDQVCEAVLKLGHRPEMMEHGSAEPGSDAISFSLRKVDESHVYVGFLAERYGHIPDDPVRNPNRLSVTELEYRHAVARGIPVLLFLADEGSVQFSAKQMDREPEKVEKLARLKDDVRKEHICGFFKSAQDLFGEVAVALSKVKMRRPATAADVPTVVFYLPRLPAPPELFAVPEYALTNHFVGRRREQAILDTWARSSNPVMVVEGIGGLGKSAVTWEWTTNRAARFAGRLWWSFYERGTSVPTFLRYALAYLTGQSPEALSSDQDDYSLSRLLVQELRQKPYLLVLDGFERVLMAYHEAAGTIPRDERMGRDSHACTTPSDDDLLRQLTRCGPSKILISTRLFPTALQNPMNRGPAPGVEHLELEGLTPDDALALMEHAGVRGDRLAMQSFVDLFGRHGLLLKIVCGMVADYPRSPFNFDAWLADPHAGGGLKLSEIELVQRNTHILHFALAGLDENTRRLLCRFAIVAESADYGTLMVLNTFLPSRPADSSAQAAYESSPEYKQGLKAFHAALKDLENRGLVSWDRSTNRREMHPVVRGYAAEMLDPQERSSTFRVARDHFASQPPDNLDKATELVHVSRSIEIYNCLIGAGLLHDAAQLFRNMKQALFFFVGAYRKILELLKPLFNNRFDQDPPFCSSGRQGQLLHILGDTYSLLGREADAVAAYWRALDKFVNTECWHEVADVLRNAWLSLNKLDRRVEAATALELAILIHNRLGDTGRCYSMTQDRANAAITRGELACAEELLKALPNAVSAEWPAWQQRRAAYQWCRLRLVQGTLEELELREVYNLAKSGRDTNDQRRALALWARWCWLRGQPERALDLVDQAIQIAHRNETPCPGEHDLRAVVLAELGRAEDARAELQRGHNRALAAEAHLKLGDNDRAKEAALNGLRWAWGPGAPHIDAWELDRCKQLLERLGVPLPTLASADPTSVPKLPHEATIRAAIPTLKPALDPENIYRVSGDDSTGRAAWYYLLVDPDKKHEFETKAKLGQIQLTNFGRIVISGYGEYPPEDAKDRMWEEYGFEE